MRKQYVTAFFMTVIAVAVLPVASDDSPFLIAREQGSKEEIAQGLLIDAEGRDIADLLQEGKVEVETKGDGMTSVRLTVRRRTHKVITVEIPPGTLFVSRNRAVYRMVVTTASTRTLDSDTWAFIPVSVVFANRPDEIPGEKDSFKIVRSPPQPELTRVMLVLEKAGARYETACLSTLVSTS